MKPQALTDQDVVPATGRRGPEKGSLVADELLAKAARAYIELEEQNKLSKSEVGRRIGLRRAPEWLDSPRFLQQLELERFNVQAEKVQGLKGASQLVDEILILSFKEIFRRLKQEPATVPAPQLWGDTTRLLKLRAELESAGSAAPAPASLMVTIRREVLLIPDPAVRATVLQRIFDEYNRALNAVRDLLPTRSGATNSGPSISVVPGALTDEVIDAPGTDVGLHRLDGALVEPSTALVRSGPRLWSDPVEDADGSVVK